MKKPPQHSQRKHSLLAPSKASVWTVCTAEPIHEEENADRVVNEESSYAREGTLAHEVADCLMKGERVPHSATRDMLDHGNGYKRFNQSLHPLGLIEKQNVELSVPLFYLPTDKGHVDYFLHDEDEDIVHVVDYKYGAGVTVSADHNKQMAIYGRSAIEGHKLKVSSKTRVHLHIYQPRSRKEEGQGPVSTWETTWDYLRMWTEKEIAVPAQLIQDKAKHLLKFRPSDSTCRWCPCKAFCGARNEWLVTGNDVVRAMVEAPRTVTQPEDLTDEQIVQLLSHAPSIRMQLKAVEDYAWGRNRAGNPVPGTKLVAGRGTRVWSNDDAVRKAALAVGVVPYAEADMLSPFALEEKAKKEGKWKALKPKVENMIDKLSGKPTLAMADDPRPEWTDNTLSEFSNLDLEELLG